ncbi:transcriptional regulator [Brevibacillus agri]|uniref:transcriptional regulator n=1 Tax=Brevibacillus agri TaxID=51101 RepID=UPI002867F38D|nr:transcriptional regulator [Brevibacillus agri]
MSATKIRKGTFQHVESELYAYHETRKEIIRLENEILHGSKGDDENVGGGRGNLPGDPTATRGMLLATYRMLDRMREVVNAIDDVYGRLPADRKKLIELKYWRKPQTLTWDGIALEIGVSRRHAMRWRDGIVLAIAERLGWV